MPTNAPATDQALLDEAVALCREAGDLTLRWFRSVELSIEHKHDGTPVTEADKGAERYLRDEIEARHPHDAVIGEEWADSTGTSGRTWIIDPIDGTKSFTHGVPLYSNLLAVYDEHGPAVGVINLPALGETVYAGRGLGCYIDGRPAHVNDLGDLALGSVCTSGLRTWNPVQLGNVLSCGAIVRTWGDGYGFGLVATGRAEVMADPAVSLWDIAPVPVIIREAGGRYTDFDGNDDLALDADAVISGVATNGVLHDEVLVLLDAHRREEAASSPDLHD